MRVESLTPVLDAAPGDQVTCRIRIHNDGSGPASYRLRLVGLDEPEPVLSVDGGAVDGGGVVDVDVPFVVPAAFAAGQHPLAFEITSDRPGERAALAPVAVGVGSLQRVVLEVRPPTIRGRRVGRFQLDVTNHAGEAVQVALDGHGPDVQVRLRDPVVAVAPGQTRTVEGRVRARRHLVGETRQHLVTIAAHGRGAPVSTTAPYRQPSLIPRPVRAAIVLLTVLALWAAAVGAVAIWWTSRGDDGDTASRAALVDTDGDGIGDTPADEVPVGELAGEDGAAPGGAGGAAGEDGAADGAADAPTTTRIGGTIKAGDTGEDAGVQIRIAPTDLGAQDTTPEGFRRAPAASSASDDGTSKIWPVRAAPLAAGGTSGATAGVPMPRQTESQEPVLSQDGGAWTVGDVPIGRSYELNFRKEGFDPQSFVVTPTPDGAPVELDVVLTPAAGAIGGVVTGPDGPLGGVQIDVTDGTITATTTTSTDAGAVGRWSIERLGTPATWTVTATLRGYGTEVAQVTLPAGGTRQLDIAMTPGVGSIGGHVRLDGQPAGGVRLTVVDGDLERTTTSLTEGDTGAFRFPALPVPGEYTVTLDVEGFIVETRRVVLSGNVDDVDFDLRRTTASLTGLVDSDRLGPLVNAAVVLTRDDLEFRTVTAAAPTAGAFAVEDLPPGTYLVTVGRFDHRSTSTTVTLSAGQSLDLGSIRLTYDPTPALAATGSVTVRLFDTNDGPLYGGTVQIVDPADGTTVSTATDAGGNQNSFAFKDLPIGTYDVRATHPIHRTIVRRVSIGLGPAPDLELNMVKLGQASGRIVDALDGTVRGGYEVTVHRLLPTGARDPSFSPLRILPDLLDGPNGVEQRWQTPVNSLTTGTYEVEVTQAPAGYAVVPDQVLDDALPVTQKMRFALPPSLETPFPVKDIEADPYPELSGRLFRPVLTGSTVTLEPLEDAAIVPTLSCGGRPPVTGEPVDEVGPSTEDDAFVFDRFLTQAQNLLGACRLSVSVPGLPTATVDLAAPMVVSNGDVATDQRVNLAIAATPATVAGTLYWLDEGAAGTQQVLLSGAAYTADDVITGFVARQNQGATAEPVAQTVDVSAATVSGAWAGAIQAFGTSQYTFTSPSIAPGAVDVTVDGVGADPTVVAANADTAVTGTGAGFGVELLTPSDGTISGRVAILTNATPRYADIPITANGGTLGSRTATPDGTGTFTIPGVAAGTWSVGVGSVADHVVRTVPPAVHPVAQRVDPGETQTGFDVTLVELADITVQVRDDGVPIDVGGVVPTVSLRHVVNPIVGDPPASSVAAASVDASGNRAFTNLAVNTLSPTGLGVQYLVSVQMDGYDLSAATVRIGTAAPVPMSATDIPVVVTAGADVTVVVDIPEWGSVTGAVQGRPGGAGVPAAQYVDLPLGELDLAQAVPVDVFGTPIGAARPLTPLTGAVDEHRFVLRAPPGRYRIDVGHPNYEDGLVAEGAPAFWDVTNEVHQAPTLPFLLEISPGTVTGTVRTSAPTGSLIDGATVELSQGATPVAPAIVTDTTGAFSFADLVPGTYRLTVTATGRFSMLADIVVPQGNTPGLRSRTLVVPLPAVDGEISLAVVAENGDGKPVPLPAYSVTRDYTEPAVIAEGATQLPNVNLDGATYDRSGAAGSTSDTVTMSSLPRGAHVLTFTPATGYSTPQPQTVPVDTGTTNHGPVAYVAADRSVVVSVTSTYPSAGSALSGATVRLVPPLADDTVGTCSDPALPAPTPSGGTYTFGVVPPRAAPYTLCVTAPLHSSGEAGQSGDATAVVAVPVLPGTGSVPATASMIASAVEVTGRIQKQDASGTTPTALSGASVELLKNGSAVGSPVTTAADGTFTFVVGEVGLYTVRASDPGNQYATRSVAVGTTEIALGESRTANLTLPRYGSVAVTVNNATVDTFTVSITNPPLSVTPTHTAGTRVYTFTGLDPDVDHTFQATTTDTGWYATTVVGNPNIGGSPVLPVTIDLRRRTVSLTVAGPPGPTNVRVGVRFPAGSGGTEVASATQPAGSFSFTSTADAIPLTGAGDVKVTAPGYRTQVVSVPTASVSTPTNALGTITLRPEVTVSGTVTTPAGVPASGLTITARNGATTLTDTLDVADPVGAPNVGTYSISGLTSGSEGEALAWVVASDILGYGVASATVNVTPTSADTVPGTNLSVYVKQKLALTFTVTSGGSPLDATVTIGGSPTATGSDGVVELTTVDEAATPIPYTVAATGKLTYSGSIDVIGAGSRTIGVPVSLANRVTTVSGTVTGAGASTSTRVRICRNDASTCSGGSNIAEVTVTGASAPFAFSLTGLSLDTGTYRVQTGSGGGTVSQTITVSQTGAITPSPLTLNVP